MPLRLHPRSRFFIASRPIRQNPAPAICSQCRRCATSLTYPSAGRTTRRGASPQISAVSLGATIVEKHVTLDPTLAGPDHAASASPSDFKAYVYDVRQAQRALGDGVKRPHASEEANRFHVRRSFHASRLLPGGHVIGASDVALLRPASGLAPSDSPLGRTVVQGIDAGEPVRESDLQP
ncbi:N-acetylneuraminate synthase family protein [Candidatus Neomicrothrix sp.]|uniref:N-acetylneuraminate synthase family protein n=1 Tax=Candidatus Neomicrothrix sp. TaxID=2719034 RepID=UPI003CD0E1BA